MTPDHRHRERIARVQQALASEGAWMVVPPSPDFRWLTGAVARSSERLVALAMPPDGDPFCLVPRLEADGLRHECPWLELEVWEDHEDPYARLARRMDLASRPHVRVGEGMRVTPLLRLASDAPCRPASDVIAAMRAVKDAVELEA